MTAKRSATSNKKKKSNKIFLASGTVVGLLLAFYVVFGVYFSSHFLPGTDAYGVAIGGLTSDSAEQKVRKKISNKQFVLLDKKTTVGKTTAVALGIKHDYKKIVTDKLAEQNPWLFNRGAEIVKADGDSVANSNNIATFVKSLFPTINDNRTVTTDASIKNKNGKFAIVKEVQGNNFSEAKLLAVVTKQINSGKSRIQIKDYYVKPKVTVKSSVLNDALKKLEKMAKVTVTYQLAGHTIQIPQATVQSWIVYSDNKVGLSQTLVQQYLSNLNTQYATVGSTRSFASTKRGTVQVSGGIYGWSINVSSEAAQVTQDIIAGLNIDRTPAIQGSGYHKDGTDIGNTYVEVDKVNQHMWVYVNGVEKISTDVVTGAPGQETPSGVFNVWSKQRNATLRGLNNDGSKYASPVDYWMPIDNTGVGLHDSPWQPKYGGDWHLTHGSHGCINTPPTTMAKLYSLVTVGTPVIVI